MFCIEDLLVCMLHFLGSSQWNILNSTLRWKFCNWGLCFIPLHICPYLPDTLGNNQYNRHYSYHILCREGWQACIAQLKIRHIDSRIRYSFLLHWSPGNGDLGSIFHMSHGQHSIDTQDNSSYNTHFLGWMFYKVDLLFCTCFLQDWNKNQSSIIDRFYHHDSCS